MSHSKLMSQEWKWSLETYPLKTVKDMFGLPCVVRLTEGYMAEDESEEFAQGDIMTIDAELVSDKIAAIFTKRETRHVEKHSKGSKVPDYGIISLNQPEVFLPFGYDGKLKVLKPAVDVSGVRDLAMLFPRFAVVRETLSVKTNNGETIKISKGTRIEIDRVIPGSTYGRKNDPDRLVVEFEHSGEKKVAPLSVDSKGKFRTEEDHEEYILSEAIERYGLPLDVKFISDEIKHIFEQDMSEGRRPPITVSKYLRLNRIVKQHVLIGHYKPIMEESSDNVTGGGDSKAANESENNGDNRTKRRTVIMLPVDNSEIGCIEVNIYDGDVLTIYEKLVNLQSVDEARDMVQDTLCVDFSVKPGIKLIAGSSRAYTNVRQQRGAGNWKSPPKSEGVSSSSEPPPLPKRPPHRLPAPPPPESPKLPVRSQHAPRHVKPSTPQSDPYLDDYEVPVNSPYLTMDYNSTTGGTESAGKTPPLLPTRRPNQSSTFISGSKKAEIDPFGEYEEFGGPQQVAVVRPVIDTSGDNLNEGYEEIDDVVALRRHTETVEHFQKKFKPRVETRKQFVNLNKEELVERLKLCKIPDVAEMCKAENLDGAFFADATEEFLKETMGLQGLKLTKFMKMKDENWVPT